MLICRFVCGLTIFEAPGVIVGDSGLVTGARFVG